jgi:N-methylhydantoinase A/oxoprolinase/acetone carboxylase beta subunit
MLVGVDTGGTFTDLVTDDGRVVKVPSTYDDPARAVRDAVAAVSAGAADSTDDRPETLAHGTTVATNALLQRAGGRVALVTTRGFADVIEIARQARPSLYDPWCDRPPALVPRELRFEVGGRLDAHGREIEAVGPGAVPSIPEGVDAVAVCLLHADLNPAHEAAVARILRDRGFDVTCSHEVSPEFREYERTVTTVANAQLRSVCRDYLRSLDPLAATVLVMTSAGGLLPAAEAAELPAALRAASPTR